LRWCAAEEFALEVDSVGIAVAFVDVAVAFGWRSALALR
jgi:hypothetical protein